MRRNAAPPETSKQAECAWNPRSQRTCDRRHRFWAFRWRLLADVTAGRRAAGRGRSPRRARPSPARAARAREEARSPEPGAGRREAPGSPVRPSGKPAASASPEQRVRGAVGAARSCVQLKRTVRAPVRGCAERLADSRDRAPPRRLCRQHLGHLRSFSPGVRPRSVSR